jgi:Cu(I)/Ag(I) efflux system membrane fusion protein
MKNSRISKTAMAFIFGLLVVSLGYSISCGSHGKEGHKTGAQSGEKHDKTTMHSDHKQSPKVDKKILRAFYEAYLPIQKFLAGDDLKAAKKATSGLENASKDISGEEEHQPFLHHLKESINGIKDAGNIKEAREHFKHLSYLTINLLQHNKYAGETKALVFHCPMAFENKGADWLQSAEGTENPYYGKSMLACGSKTKTIHE